MQIVKKFIGTKKAFFLTILFAFVLLISGYNYSMEIENNANRLREITLEDPLFYDPSLDTEQLEKAIIHLRSREAVFLIEQEQHLRMRKASENLLPANTKLFPTEIILSLGTVSANTDRFINNPTANSARKLISSYKKIARQYELAAIEQSKFIRQIIDKEPELKETEVQFVKTATSLTVIYDDFELIKSNAKKLKEEISAREKCLYIGVCENIEHINKNEPRDESVRQIATEDKTFEAIFPIDLIKPATTDEMAGPYFIDTICWGDKKPFYIFYSRDDKNKVANAQIRLADQIYYLDYTKLTRTWTTANKILEVGPRYNHQNMTNDYRCPDLTYQPKLLEFVRENIEGNESLSQGGVILSKENNLWGLPFIINNISLTLDSLILDHQISKLAASSRYIATTRLDYSIFYLPFSKSVWRIGDKPSYILKANLPIPSFFETYTSLKKRGYTDEDMKKFSIPQINLLKNAAKN